MTIDRDPDACLCGSRHTKVVKRRRGRGFLRRRHQCLDCARRWNSYQTTINPKQLHQRR